MGGTDIVLSIDNDVNNYENIRLSCVFGDDDDGSKTSNNVNATSSDDVSSWPSKKVDATWISSNEILCVTPSWSSSIAGNDNNNVSLSLESNDDDNVGTMMMMSSSSPLQFFYYYESPIIKSIFPTMGTALGGTIIKLHGSNFIKLPTGMKCQVGNIEVPTHLDDAETVSCITPPGIVNSSHVISLSFNHGIDYTYSSEMFRYTESPLVRTIWPTLGSRMGGTTLTIDGDYFEDTDELKCIFRLQHTNHHSTLTTDAEFVSSTQLACPSPAVESSTSATVHATVNGVDTTSSSVPFEFIEDAVISSISPDSGPINGGTLVTLIGSGMINGESSLHCRFGEGSEPVSGQWISGTEIQCIAPRGGCIGVVNVTLSLNGLDYTTSSAEFLYYEHPTISSIYPTFGVSHGGTPVIVNGYGFQPSKFHHVLCRFGNDIYTKGSFDNETSVSCVSPGGNTGSSHLVSVSLNGVDFSPSSVHFRYTSPVEVRSISPKWSDEAGGTRLKVFGEGFEDTVDLACIFQNRQINSIRIRAEYLSATELQCPTPPKTTANEVVLRVTVNGVDISSSTARFEYVPGATVSTMKPVRGLAANSTQVTLYGDGFLDENTIRCRFGESIVKAKWFSRTIVRCASPISASEGNVVVSYSNDGINFVDVPTPFSFIIISNVEPQYGTNRGATEVQISGHGEFNNAGGWKCIFGVSSVPTVFASTSEIRCLTPAYEGVSSVELALVDPEGSVIKTGYTFDYFEELELVSLFPDSSPISGGGAITIELNGLQLDSSYACVFGDDVEVPATLINNSFVECTIPPRDTPEQTTLTVKASNSSIPITTVEESAAFTFYEQPNISSASLSSFYVGFSTDIKVSGGLFFNSSHAKCRLGEHEVKAQWISDSEMVCAYTSYSIEPKTLLELPLAISMNGVDFHDSGITLDIYPHLTIDSIHPSYGSMAGSTRVTVSGRGFVDSFRYRCRFGTKFTNAEFSSPNEIICGYAPLSLPGRMDFWLCVGDNDDCLGGEELVFEYFLDSLHLLDAQPMEGSFEGGTLVQVTSNHPFGNHSTCSFGNEVVKLEDTDGDTMGIGVCESPPYTFAYDNVSSASVAFSISANGQESSHEPFQFVYHESLLPEDLDYATTEVQHARVVGENAVHVSHISPTMGLKGTNIAVFGSGFAHLHHETAVCAFGLKQVPIIPVSNTTIMCASPWNLLQLESVLFNVMDSSDHVKIYAGDDNITFTYVEMPSLLSVKPEVIVQTNTSTSISVEGNNFHVLSNEYVQCRVGPTKSTARFDTSTGTAICNHTFPVTGSFPFELLNEQYGIISSSHVEVHVIEMPRLHHLEPSIVVAERDNTNSITLKGENFYKRNLSCVFNEQQSHHATFISESEVLCHLPAALQPGPYEVRMSNDDGASFEQSQYLMLEVLSPPSIAAVIPSMGESGSKVTITGKSFHPQMECQFGTDIVETQFINSTALQCTTPKDTHQESVSVVTTLNRVPVSTEEPPLFFTFVDLSIASINPRFGDIFGGTRVTFNMKDDKTSSVISHCKFGDTVVPATSNQSELACVSPPMHTPGAVDIGVSVNGDDFSAIRQLIFDYTKPASFSSMHPTSGPDTGGTVITLAGSHFVNDSVVKCYFGGVNVAGRYVSDDKLTCETPSMKPGNYTVDVSLNGVDVLNTQQTFYVYPKMTALFAQPSFGETGGGTQIQVIGTNFREDPLSCQFGSVNVNARYINSTVVECSTPKWEIEGLVDLVIVSENGQTAIVPSGFDFFTPFHIASIHPSNGFTRGGTDLTVKGDHFSQILGPVQCLVGDIAVEAEVASDVEITCTTPPSLFGVGKVEFALTYGSDKFTLHNQTFQYEDEIVLDAVLPEVVPSTTDKLVTVYGSMFRNTTQLCCMITTSQKRIEATYISDSQVLCRVPKALHPGIYSLSVSNNGQDYSETTTNFSVIDPLLVKRINPSIGQAGSNVFLEGNNFQDLNNLGCLVDEKYIVPSQFINTTLIQCQLPLSIERGAVSIALVLDGVPISAGPPLFFTFVNLSLTSINPTFGDNTGGTRVTFSLKEESPQVVSHCIFGEIIVPSIVHNGEAELVCVSPPMQTTGPVQVGVSVDGEDFSMSELSFNLTKPAVFSSMNPTSGSETGGTVITLSGSNFANSNNVTIYFGNVEASGRWVSDEELTCETPSMKPGNYKVRVTLNGVDTLRTSWQFTFHKEIDVLYASPSSGSIHGGTEISIIGKSFVPSDTLTCQFGNLGYSKAAFVTSTEVLCSSPDVSKKVLDLTEVDLRISLNGVDFSSASADFRFTPIPTIHSIYPSEGSISGGTQVTINGTDMFSSIISHTAVCIFGNETVPASLPSSDELTCVSPPHSTNEEVFFGVSLNGVDLVQHRATSSFLYLPIVKTVSIEPSGGPFTGGTLVSVTGDDFTNSSSMRCKFGSSYSDGMLYISEHMIQCRSPPYSRGTVSFVVITDNDDDDITQEEVTFEYYKPPTILFASPITGPHHGGTLVRIYGSDFRSNVNYLCYFGAVQVSAQFVASDAIQCPSPGILPGDNVDDQMVNLTVSEKNSNFTANTLEYTFVPAPSLTILSPPFFFFDGGDSVSITGSHLNTTGDVWCRFTLPTEADESQYYETIQATSVFDDEHIACQVPAYPLTNTQVEAFVEVSTNGWDYSTTRLSFKYTPKPTIQTIHPSLGTVNGGTVVTVHGADFLQESKLWCAFGKTASVPASWLSQDKVSCTSPAVSYPANVSLSLHFEENSVFVEGSQYFAYHRELSLEEAYPMRGFVHGETTITITGTGFLDVPTLSCQFGSVIVPAKFYSRNSIECISPQVNQAQCVELKVSLNEEDFSSFAVSQERGMFTYDEEIDLYHTIPTNVQVYSAPNEMSNNSGTISVIGSAFVNSKSLSCRYGESHVTTAHYVSETEVKCHLPIELSEPGEMDVRISLNGVDYSRNNTSIAFVEPTLISSISPQQVQEGQAIDILVKGEHFIQSSLLQCRFGRFGHLWSPAHWIDSTTLKCMTPPLNMTHDGVEYVSISNNGGHHIGQVATLGVTARVRFISMHPTLGYVNGGTNVVITLGNAKYMSNLVCHFGNEDVPVTLYSGNSVLCKSPAYHLGGDVTLKLISDGVHLLATGAFEYISPPQITSLQPPLGPLEGGTTVFVSGERFTGVSHCRFNFSNDFQIAVPAHVQSDSSLQCDTPAYEKDVDALVELTHNEKDYIGNGHMFTYRANPRMLDLYPSYGSDLGGKTIYISGENFLDTGTCMCNFGTSLVDAVYISRTLLSCEAPAMKIGRVPVSITMNGVDFITNKVLEYQSIKLPQLKTMEPTVGIVNGNTTVIVSTTALHKNERLECHCYFGEHKVSATYLSSNSVSCAAPPLGFAGVVNVSLSVDGERYLADGLNTLEFTYASKPEVTSISPNFGWTIGGAEVTLAVNDLEPFLSSEMSCSFGDSNNFTVALQVSNDTVTCASPPFEEPMEQHAPIVLLVGNGTNAFHIKSSAFSYYEPSVVTKIHPEIGSIRGGSSMTVSGIYFSDIKGLQCQFGEDTSVDAEFVDEREIKCVLPEWNGGPKIVDVHIGIKDGPRLSLVSHASFEYLTHPSIQSIHPKFGSTKGGTHVSIRGNALSWPDAPSYISCQFGNSSLVPVTASATDDGALICKSPPHNDVASMSSTEMGVPVSIFANHGHVWLATSDERFVYSDHIEVNTLGPNSGPSTGGTVVTISAQDMHHLPVTHMTCHFGNNIVPASYFKDKDVLKCMSPAIGDVLLKTVMLNLGINGLRDVESIGRVFTYYRAPSVSSIGVGPVYNKLQNGGAKQQHPAYGFLEGGEDVFVSGNGFRNVEGLGCRFDNAISPKVVWLSETSIICTSPSLADTKRLTKRTVRLQVTNNGLDYTDIEGAPEYRYIHRPDASKVEPETADWESSTNITITGKSLMHASACVFGDDNKLYPTLNVTNNSIICEAPPATNRLPPLSGMEPKIPIFLELDNGIIATGLELTYKKPIPKIPERMSEPQIISLLPSHGSSDGGDLIRVQGEGFFNTEGLACKFGQTLADAYFISESEVRCRTPRHLPGKVTFDVLNSRLTGKNESSGFDFTFLSDLSLSSIFPSFGSVKGDTVVSIFGSFPSSSLGTSQLNIKCKFGDGVVEGELVNQNEISCATPRSAIPETAEVTISLDGGHNFAKSSIWFSYVHESEIESLHPNYGYPDGGASISVVGKNFRNSTGLKCLFGEKSVTATFISKNRVSCISPPHEMKRNGNRVAMKLASDGEIGSSWKYFKYIAQPNVTSIHPLYGHSFQEGVDVTVKGSGFRNVMQLYCRFGKVKVQAEVINGSTLLCPIPRHPPGVVDFRIIDQYAHYTAAPEESASQFHFIPEASIYNVNPTWNVTQAGMVAFARGTNFDTSDDIACAFGQTKTNAIVMSGSLLSCQVDGNMDRTKVAIGLHGSIHYAEDSIDMMQSFYAPTAPNGTIMNHNITLCEPGTFQPQNGQEQCLPCPVGYVCPSFGLSKPVLCPAGSICERLGLIVPSSLCLSGHYCNEGTKMSSPIASSATETWLYDDESGVMTTVMTNSAWDYVPRTPPATGAMRISHPPIDMYVKAQQPFPCPVGFFCREGVSSIEHREGDYTTPQPCFDGYFCPR